MSINIPHEWRPRGYQLPLWRYLEGGGTRAVGLWHRRAGKDVTTLNWTCWAAHKRVGTYWHMLPTANQARKVVWDGIVGGKRLIDQVFPPEIRSNVNNTDMKIELKCGSLWQCVGSDNYNALVGGNPVGIVNSEYAIADPAAWDFFRPILTENGGWSVFIYTSRGWNHGADLFERAQELENWFCERLTVDDTEREDGTPVVSQEAIQEERDAGMPEPMVQQEFYCSFDAPLVGAYYGDLIQVAEQEGRIGEVPWEPDLPVHTCWDLGMHDMTSIWFFQLFNREIRWIDYYENAGVGLDHYAKILKERPYAYEKHLMPHDVKVRELGTIGAKSRLETLFSLGIRGKVVQKVSPEDRVQAVRNILPRSWFDRRSTKKGLAGLRQYQRKWNDETKTFQERAKHDWASHPADAFGTGAVGLPRNEGPLMGPILYDNRGIV